MKLEPINTPKGPLNEGGDKINDNEEVMERVKQTEHDADVSDISDGEDMDDSDEEMSEPYPPGTIVWARWVILNILL